MVDAVARVKDLLGELGIAGLVTAISPNVWTLQKGQATVHIVAAREFVVATAKVADRLPATDREDLLRMLLSANVQLLGAFFTLEADDSIRINQVLPAEWLQAKELAFILGNVATKTNDWVERLKAVIR